MMNRLVVIASYLALYLFAPEALQAQSAWKAAGTIPDSVTAICANAVSGRLLVGTVNGLYVTEDTGTTWARMPSPDPGITALVALKSGKILCGTNSGLFFGSDSGGWLPTEVTTKVTAINDTGWVGTVDGSVYAPDDSELHWWKRLTAPKAGPEGITAIALDDVNNYAVIAGSLGILRSSADTALLPVVGHLPKDLVGLRIDIYNANKMIAVSRDSGVFASMDKGATWTPLDSGLTDLHVGAFAHRAFLTTVISTSTGIFRLPQYFPFGNDTEKWIDCTAGLPLAGSMVLLDVDQRKLLHCVLPGGKIYTQWVTGAIRVVKSTKSPADFLASNNGVLFNTGSNSFGLSWPRGSGDGYMFGAGLWVAAKKDVPNLPSPVNGWTFAGSVPDSILGICANSVSKLILAIGSHGLYYRNDSGIDWHVVSLPTGAANLGGWKVLALPTGQFLLASGKYLFVGSPQSQWIEDSVGSTINAVSEEGVLLGSGKVVFIPNSDWTAWRVQATLPSFSQRYISSRNNGATIAVLNSNGSGWISTDSGSTWNASVVPGASGSAWRGITFGNDGSLFIASSSGVYQSYDLGRSWQARNAGLKNVWCLSMQRNSQDIAVSTLSGLFVLPATSIKSGAWTERTAGQEWADSISVISFDASGALHAAFRDTRTFTEWKLQPGLTGLCELGYNPNTGLGWFTPGEIGAPSDVADPAWKYFPYISSSFSATNGSPVIHDKNTPLYRWPVWQSDASKSVQKNFYFGTYTTSVQQRDALASGGKQPVFISDEDIVNAYSDQNTSANPEYKPNSGYPLGLNIHESVYSWGFGRYRDLIFVRYFVTNTSSEVLHDCYLAPALDPDLAPSGLVSSDMNGAITSADAAAVTRALGSVPEYEQFVQDPSRLNLGFQKRQVLTNGKQYGMEGFALVETPVVSSSGDVIDDADSTAVQGYGSNGLYQAHRLGLNTLRRWTFNNDPSNSSERYDFVSSGLKDRDDGRPADQRMLLSTGPFNLRPGQSASTTLAIGIAHPSTTDANANFDSLLRLMASAHLFFANAVQVGSDPNSVTIHNFEQGVRSRVSSSVPARAQTLHIETYPNPMSSAGTIRFNTTVYAGVSLSLYDQLGREVMTVLTNKTLAIGTHEITVDLSKLSSGNYVVRLECGESLMEHSVVVLH